LRRRDRGTAVAVGCLDTHARPRTCDLLTKLVGTAAVAKTLDVDAVLAERPDVVLVDQLAYTNPAGSVRAERWQDVEVLLGAGIDVITTLTVQHIDSLVDPVSNIVGSVPQSLVPDEFLLRTSQIELVDISPSAIRRRIAHGNVFAPDELRPIDADLFNSNAFARLRSLLLFWMANHLSASELEPHRVREKVVVAVTNSPTAGEVVRRAARLAQSSRSELLAVHVAFSAGSDDRHRAERKNAVERLGGTYYEVTGDDVTSTLLSFAATHQATQLVLGTPRTNRWTHYSRRSITDRVIRQATSVDVHVVSISDSTTAGRARHWQRPVTNLRTLIATVSGIIALGTLTAVFTANRGGLSVATSLAIYLLVVVGITAIGGRRPGLAAAVAAPLLANWFLIPPFHTFRINDADNLIELLVFISVAFIVSAFVSIAERNASEAKRAQHEAATLASITGSGNLELPEVIVEQLRRVFHLDGVAVLAIGSGVVEPLAANGRAPLGTADADLVIPCGPGLVVAATGPTLSADDHRVLQAFASQLARAFEQQRLRKVASEADAFARADELRTAILRAVSHDLRAPLANIKATVSSLRQTDIDWPEDLRDDFLASIETDTDRLTSIVTNLLDLSRLQAGVLRPVLRDVSLEEVVPGAVYGLGNRARDIVVELPTDLAEVRTDPALLDRALANLVDNALHWSPVGLPIMIRAHRTGNEIQVHVIDHGPGVPLAQRAVVVQPFHRLGDSGSGAGLGLGLAIVDRLLAAMSAGLELRDTPGGGLTAVISLPVALSDEFEQ
jgi:two-component system, OmpR family, sensor histidine kinase KdpD